MSLMPISSLWADVKIDGIYYSLDSSTKTAEVAYNNSSTSIENVVIPEIVNYEEIEYIVTSISFEAFHYNDYITSVFIPKTVTSIGGSAFGDCENLATIKVASDNPYFTNYDNGIEAVYSKDMTTLVVVPCTAIGEFTIPNTVTELAYGAFDGCHSLTNVIIPSSITIIGDYVFANCAKLNHISIPESVTSIGKNCFDSCYELTSVTFEGIIPPTMSSDIFYGCNLEGIIVPEGASNLYIDKLGNQYTYHEEKFEQSILNQRLRTVVSNISQIIYNKHTDFSNHGLLKNINQLSTNKQETTEGPISNLIDGDGNTYFHSTWTTTNTDGAFAYIQVDLQEEVQNLIFQYARRGPNFTFYSLYSIPTKIRLFATNIPTSEWNEIGVYNLNYNETYFGLETFGGHIKIRMNAPYRYIRFVVEETLRNDKYNNHLYFYLSEIALHKMYQPYPTEVIEEFENLLTTAELELSKFSATEKTINALEDYYNYLLNFICVELKETNTFTNNEERTVGQIIYTRNFNNTNWQAWYMPFDVDYDDISDKFIIARLNNVHQFDDDDNGEFERWALEVLRLKSGDVVYGNIPYMVKAKEVGEQQIQVFNTTLYKSESETLDCSSTSTLYTFVGTYAPIAGSELANDGCYVMSSGKLLTPTQTTTLKPFRWYLKHENRSGYPVALAPKQILVFENGNFDTTDIEYAFMDGDSKVLWPADVYNLNGQLVLKHATNLDALPKGVYLVKGKKIMK